MTKKEMMYQRIIKHGEQLSAVFHLHLDGHSEEDLIKLCKSLRRIEAKAERLAVNYCNGDIDCEIWDTETEKMLNKIDSILHFRDTDYDVFINGDPRGYALKIRNAENIYIHKDMGGYGIIAPDLN